jgi:hypothetical protein
LHLARAPAHPSLLRQQKFAFDSPYSATLACIFSQHGHPEHRRGIPLRKL